VINFYFNNKISDVRSWPSTPGTIQSANLEVDMYNNYHLKATYTYSVGGQSYTNNMVSVWNMQKFDDVSHLKGIISGAQVPILYNPQDPAESYIFSGVQKLTGYIIGLVVILIATGLFLHYNTDLFGTGNGAPVVVTGGTRLFV
jgi:hypothetical protein